MYSIGAVEAALILTDHYPSLSISRSIISAAQPYFNALDLNLRLTPISALGAVLVVAGTLLRKLCYRKLQRSFTFTVTIQKDHQLITTGPYSVVRHPSYFGLLVVYTGMFCLYGSKGSVVRESGVLDTNLGRGIFGVLISEEILILVSLLKRMAFEDAVLKENFGEKWTEWQRNVPYSLIPWVY